MAQTAATVTVHLPANSRPVKYAEELGVTRLFEELQGFHEQYGGELASRTATEQAMREARDLIDERKYELMEKIGADSTLTSQAAIDRAFRSLCGKDQLLGEREQQYRQYQDQLGEYEVAVKHTEARIRAHLAQMRILGGYLEYLAAERQGRTLNRVLGTDL